MRRIEQPAVIECAPGFLAVYKPPRMHCAPLPKSPGPSLLEWCAASFPEAGALQGRRPGEGGLLHRLDYEARGLVLIARSREALDSLLRQQAEGAFVKEYEALSAGGGNTLPGFPPLPAALARLRERGSIEAPLVIESPFRPYSPGRKAVRPAGEGRGGALDRGRPYQTEILALEREGELYRFRARLRRGFRHQIRAHLAWLGFPLCNDGLYGPGGPGFLALCACSLSFFDPAGEHKTITLPWV